MHNLFLIILVDSLGNDRYSYKYCIGYNDDFRFDSGEITTTSLKAALYETAVNIVNGYDHVCENCKVFITSNVYFEKSYHGRRVVKTIVKNDNELKMTRFNFSHCTKGEVLGSFNYIASLMKN